MKMISMICVWVLLIPFELMANDVPKDSALTINANLYLNGPHDGNWKVTISEFDDLNGARIIFSRINSVITVSFSGSSILYKNELQLLKSSIFD